MTVHRAAASLLLGLLTLWLGVVTAIGQPQPSPIEVRWTTARIPLDVDRAAAAFQRASPHVIPLVPQTLIRPFGGGTVKAVRVRALHDGKMIYVELSWADGTKNASPRRQTEFTDGAALMFPILPGTLPNIFMGDPTRPVNIWFWRAAWQDELTRARDLRAAYPDMTVDYYYTEFLKNEEARRTFNAGAAAGNLLSFPTRTSAVEDLVAWGFGTLTTQPRQDVVGFGMWRAGRWTVLLTRPLQTPDEADAGFRPGATTHVNFAIWDGGNRDRNGQKNITLSWWPMRLQPKP